MNKLLVVYNTCGISGRRNVPQYINSLNHILNQDLDGCKVIVSSCLNEHDDRQELINTFGNRLSYNFIDESLPVNVTFNHALLKGVEEFGEFDGYLYIDSGINLPDSKTFRKIFDLYKSGSYGMVATRVDVDAGTNLWFGLGGYLGDESQTHTLYRDGHFDVPVGKAVNLHVQIWSAEMWEFFGRRAMPDIFASYCTESVFSFMCAALKSKWTVHKDTMVNHVHGMDGGSSGFEPKYTGRPPWQHLFKSPKTMQEIIADPVGIKAGFGYEECENIMMHDPSQYDENGYCINDDLAPWIKDNLFLKREQQDYDTIVHTWIP